VLTGTSLGEKCVEGIIAAANSLIARHLAIGLDTVLQAKQFPTSVPDLNTGLPNMDAEALAHGVEIGEVET
jgi:hypothetical protein